MRFPFVISFSLAAKLGATFAAELEAIFRRGPVGNHSRLIGLGEAAVITYWRPSRRENGIYSNRYGRPPGVATGPAEGRIEGLIDGTEVAVEIQFGEAGLRLMHEIRAIADEVKLEAVLHAIRTAASPDDMRPERTGLNVIRSFHDYRSLVVRQ